MRYIYNCGVSLSVCVGRALRIILDWDRGIEERVHVHGVCMWVCSVVLFSFCCCDDATPKDLSVGAALMCARMKLNHRSIASVDPPEAPCIRH